MSTLFVTGTDTGVGKTRVACALLHRARQRGFKAAGFKPVASGAEGTPEGLRNDDALALLAASGGGLAYDAVNPYCFAPPIAPHLAARAAGVRIDTRRLDAAQEHLAADHDLVIVEGAGGWLVPLDESETFGDWVGRRAWPVVLVVGLRLGCISHALLSVEAIARRTRLAGWIANRLPPAQERGDEVVRDLRRRIAAPFWGIVEAGADELCADGEAFEKWLEDAQLNET